MKKPLAIILVSMLVIFIGLSFFFSCTSTGKAAWNNWFYAVHKANDNTNYNTKKQVENTCRAMIASYEADKLTYEQYKSSDNAEKQSWAEQAKIRANKTAMTYNDYILKNSYVWQYNIPEDIKQSLDIIN